MTLAYVAEFLAEDEPLLTARHNAAEVGGVVPVDPVCGAALRFTTAAIAARAVVEIGTGCGTSGIWLLRGMREGSVLTSVDVEPEYQRLARGAFVGAGFGPSRYRLISGRALEVLPRLADGAYDLVFCDGDQQEYPDYLVAALRLLRPGGVLAFDNALPEERMAGTAQAGRGRDGHAPDRPGHEARHFHTGHDELLRPAPGHDELLRPAPGHDGLLRAAPPGHDDQGRGPREPDDSGAAAVLELCEQVRTHDRLVPLLLPIGGGLLAAVKRG